MVIALANSLTQVWRAQKLHVYAGTESACGTDRQAGSQGVYLEHDLRPNPRSLDGDTQLPVVLGPQALFTR